MPAPNIVLSHCDLINDLFIFGPYTVPSLSKNV